MRHINEYHEGKLNNESGGSESKLAESQTEELIAHLDEHTSHHVHAIILVIKDTWGIGFSMPGMNQWLHRYAFSYKKPKGLPYQATPQFQEDCITQDETLQEESGVDEPILLMAAVHPTQATKLAYGWIRIGQTKHIDTTGSCTRLNIVGAIST